MKPEPGSFKILNDPVHGFIEVPSAFLLAIIDHPVFQRLRRIKQVGLSSLVYPGALHTRFNHALGAMYLTQQALGVLRRKGLDITPAETEATLAAILLHDVGHGPFSHALETILVPGVRHEQLSETLMQRLNAEMGGGLSLAIDVFLGRHPKAFLHQLVSSQLDMDRMDYLMRDSFFTGVQEGIVSAERIIKVLNVKDNQLVVEYKGIYSIEKFIMARRLMYWQVYLHKTALAAECMLVNILHRAKQLAVANTLAWCDAHLLRLFQADAAAVPTPELVADFLALDDYDLHYCLKQWQQETDGVLSDLCRRLQERRLLKLRFLAAPLPQAELMALRKQHQGRMGLGDEAVGYYVFQGMASNLPYLQGAQDPIRVMYKDGTVADLAQASDMAPMAGLTGQLDKPYLCTPG